MTAFPLKTCVCIVISENSGVLQEDKNSASLECYVHQPSGFSHVIYLYFMKEQFYGMLLQNNLSYKVVSGYWVSMFPECPQLLLWHVLKLVIFSLIYPYEQIQMHSSHIILLKPNELSVMVSPGMQLMSNTMSNLQTGSLVCLGALILVQILKQAGCRMHCTVYLEGL